MRVEEGVAASQGAARATQSVSPLLVFSDKGAEADATALLQHVYARHDWRLHKSGVLLNLLLAWHMWRTCGWRAPLPVLAEAAVFAVAHWLWERRRGLYLHHRSLLLGAILAGHQVMVAKWVTPCLYGPSSPGPLGFWLRELNLCLVPWATLLSLAYPVPLKHAVWSQAALVACMLACLPRQHQLSTARVATSDQHYMQAARALIATAAAVLPAGASKPFADGLSQLLGPTGAFYLVQTAALLLGVLVTLLVLVRFELPCRMHFACERGLADSAHALMRRRSQWRRMGIPDCIQLVAAGWAAGCFATLPFKAAGLFGQA